MKTLTAGQNRLTPIIDSVRAENLRSLYIIASPDPSAADDLIALLKEKLLVPGLEAFDCETVNAGDIGKTEGVSVEILIQRTKQPPIASRRRLIIIRHLEKLDRDTLATLCTALANLPDSCVVVALTDYERALNALFQKSGVGKYFITLPHPNDEGLRAQVRRSAEKADLHLTPEAIEMLIEIAGDDSAILKSEIEKLATALEPNSKVSLDSVRKYASSTRVFELRDYVWLCLDRNTKKALALLHKLEQAGEEPIKIIAWLTNALLDVLAVKSGIRSEDSLWRSSKQALRRWSEDRLEKALHKLYKINVLILRGYPEPFALLDIWTIATGVKGDEL